MKTEFPKNSFVSLALCGALLGVALPSLHAQHRFTRLHSFGATNLAMFAPWYLIEGSDGALYGALEEGGVVRLSKDGADYTMLRSFSGQRNQVVVEGSDGVLYGTTVNTYASTGSVFRLSKDGTGYAVLRSFTSSAGDGLNPWALIEGRDGVLYGTTQIGGSENGGTVFKMRKDGTGYTVLRSLLDSERDGIYPFTLFEGIDGILYGTAGDGGGAGYDGTVFRLNKDGTSFTVLHRFSISAGEGTVPAALVEGRDGALYGLTAGDAAVFKLNKDGSSFTVLRQLEDTGEDYYGSLVEGADGALYGAEERAGSFGWGWVFKVNKDGSGFSVLHEFSGTNGDGMGPYAPLAKARDGTIYGTTWGGGTQNCGTLFELNPDGTGYQVLTSFQGNVPIKDGATPAGLVQASGGAIYGITVSGGFFDKGTVFKQETDGTGYCVLWSLDGTNGAFPSGITEGRDGAFYGTTTSGGSNGCGTVFTLTRDGAACTVLHDFLGGPSDGRSPQCKLLEGTDGALYGTTQGGGAFDYGTIFTLSKDGSGYRLLHNFQGGVDDGCGPRGPVLEGIDGLLYGTTMFGGLSNLGAIYALNQDGSGYRLIHSFRNTDSPYGALWDGGDDYVYGTASGEEEGPGVVFRVRKDGSDFQLLHSFTGGDTDGDVPRAGLVAGGDGALYGTTVGGGKADVGTVFKSNSDSSGYRVVWSFSGDDGRWLAFELIEGRDGALYGVAPLGGDSNSGTLFRLEVAPVLYNPVWSSNVFSFQFNARSNGVYQPQFKSSLADSNWTALPSLTGQRGVVTVTDTNLDSSPRFYRVVTP